MDESTGARARCTCGRGASRRLLRSDQTELPTRTGLLPGQTGASAWRGANVGPIAVALTAYFVVRNVIADPVHKGARLLEFALAIAVGAAAYFIARSFISRVGRVASAQHAESRREDPDAMWEQFEWMDATVTVGSGGQVDVRHEDCDFPSVSVDPSECAPAALGVLQGPIPPNSTLRLLRCPVGHWVTGARVVAEPTAPPVSEPSEPVAQR